MASAFAHAFAAASLGAAMVPGRLAPRLIVVGVVCAILPDVDVLGFRAGIAYGDLLGHRGLSHSLAFAAGVALLAVPMFFAAREWKPLRLRVGVYLFLATASHGLLDALTNGGLGVAFFSPFDPTRYFLPLQPVEVSPIGLAAFFGSRGVEVLASEIVWIGLPWTLFVLGVYGARRWLSR